MQLSLGAINGQPEKLLDTPHRPTFLWKWRMQRVARPFRWLHEETRLQAFLYVGIAIHSFHIGVMPIRVVPFHLSLFLNSGNPDVLVHQPDATNFYVMWNPIEGLRKMKHLKLPIWFEVFFCSGTPAPSRLFWGESPLLPVSTSRRWHTGSIAEVYDTNGFAMVSHACG